MERIIEAEELDTYLAKAEVVIDVRSPEEYAVDHIPGAVNIPVLSNDERAEVGTLYTSHPFEARKLGATYATAAIHEFLKSTRFTDWHKNTRILVYCARGGQRSGSFSLVLSQIGFPVWRLQKGYKSYRQWVLSKLARPLPGPIYVLYGYTGSGKTKILQALAGEVNVLDLEGLAHHRGSLLGKLPGRPQPAQRAFESALADTLESFDPKRPTLIEGESRKVGRLAVPDSIWRQMKTGNHLWLEIPRAERVRYILEDYRELCNEALLREPMNRLARYVPRATMAEMEQLTAQRDWPELVEKLLAHHYDPLYARPLKHDQRLPLSAATIDQGLAAVRRTVLAEEPLPSASP